MKKWIRNYLGINDIYDQINAQNCYITGLRGSMTALNQDIAVPLANIAAILCDEQSDARKAASDHIGKEAPKRLIAEAAARAPYNYPND